MTDRAYNADLAKRLEALPRKDMTLARLAATTSRGGSLTWEQSAPPPPEPRSHDAPNVYPQRDPRPAGKCTSKAAVAERAERLRVVVAEMEAHPTTEAFDKACGELLGMTANGVKLARRRMGLPAKVAGGWNWTGKQRRA